MRMGGREARRTRGRKEKGRTMRPEGELGNEGVGGRKIGGESPRRSVDQGLSASPRGKVIDLPGMAGSAPPRWT